MEKLRSIKVEAATLEEANKLKLELRRRGTAALPPALRPAGEVSFGYIFRVGVLYLKSQLRGRKATS